MSIEVETSLHQFFQMSPRAGKVRQDGSQRHGHDGLDLLDGPFFHVEKKHHRPLGRAQAADSHVQMFVFIFPVNWNIIVFDRRYGRRCSGIIGREPVYLLRGGFHMVIPAVPCDAEKPCRESRTAFIPLEREISLQKGLLRDIVGTESVTPAQASQEPSQRLLLDCNQVYELLTGHPLLLREFCFHGLDFLGKQLSAYEI